MNWYLRVLKKYAVFTGRACRKEFWYFKIIDALILAIFMAVHKWFDINLTIATIVYSFLIFPPSYAVLIRRLHDSGKAALWVLVPLVPLITLVITVLLMTSYHQVLLPQTTLTSNVSVISTSAPELISTPIDCTASMPTAPIATNLPVLPDFLHQLLAKPEIPEYLRKLLQDQLPVFIQAIKNIDVMVFIISDIVFLAIFQLLTLLLLLVFTLEPSFIGENEYGPNPQEPI